jgi:hypothetical protein
MVQSLLGYHVDKASRNGLDCLLARSGNKYAGRLFIRFYCFTVEGLLASMVIVNSPIRCYILMLQKRHGYVKGTFRSPNFRRKFNIVYIGKPISMLMIFAE